MRYELPRYIEEEAKIAGPLNIKQFFILFGGIIFSTTYFIFFKAGTAIFLTVLTLAGIAALLLGKYQGRPLSEVVIHAINFFWLPKLYVLKKKDLTAKEVFVEEEKPLIIEKPAEEDRPAKHLTPQELKDLAKELDKKPN